MGRATESLSSIPRVVLSALLVSWLVACGPSADGEGSAAGDDAGSSAAAEDGERGPEVPDTPVGALLSRALEHHDPDDVWSHRPIELRWVSLRPDGTERVASLLIDNTTGHFGLEMDHRGHHLEYEAEGDETTILVDGSTAASPEAREALSLDREAGLMWRNYFHFLVGLPMKLTDPGASLDEDPMPTRFQDREVLAIQATYATDDGYPYWAFYFDPDSAELVGARFWREGPEMDGEYIVMEGAAEAGSLRIPASRAWYMNADDEYLGTDEVRGLTVGP